MVPDELRFHAELTGLAGFLRGQIDSEWVTSQLRTHWASRRGAAGREQGLTTVVAPEAYAAAVDRFERTQAGGAAGACRELLLTVVRESLPEEDRSRGWVEMTPPNLEAAQELALMFPEARFVHAIRSGLDVACSMQRHAWAPDGLEDCLFWWEDRFARADAGARSLPA
jgi:hypothetical protein